MTDYFYCMNMTMRSILLCLMFWLSSFSSFDTVMDQLAMDLAQSLQLNPNTPLHLTVITQDQRHMLSLRALLTQLHYRLHPYSRQIIFNPFRSQESGMIRSIIQTGCTDYAPIGFGDQRLDSLILFGEYHIRRNVHDTVNVVLSIINQQAQPLFRSRECVLTKKDSPAGIVREVFDNIESDEALKRLWYKGTVIDKLDILFLSPHNNLLAYPASYRFENQNPYTVQWQVALLQEVLTTKYGIVFCDSSPDLISIEPAGTFRITRNNKQRCSQGLVAGEPLIPLPLLEQYDSLYYLYTPIPTTTSSVTLESKPVATAHEKNVRDHIFHIFNTVYPRMFQECNFKALDAVYIDKPHPSILVGTKLVSDPETSREIISYSWHTKQSWLAGLQRACQNRNRTFAVATYVMGIFNDNLDPCRYWALVAQQWKTKNSDGVTVYHDDGFLIVNFDFNMQNEATKFGIHYRLWFYNYQYDHEESGINRYDKLIADINKHFVNTFSGIDFTLKQGMRDFLIRKIRSIGQQKLSGTQNMHSELITE